MDEIKESLKHFTDAMKQEIKNIDDGISGQIKAAIREENYCYRCNSSEREAEL